MSLLIFIFLAISIVIGLDLRLEEIVMVWRSQHNSLKHKINPRHRWSLPHFQEIKNIIEVLHYQKYVALIVVLSLFLVFVAIVVSMLLDNYFLLIPLIYLLLLFPLFYFRYLYNQFYQELEVELETTISLINASYYRTNNLILSIEENLVHLKPPLKTCLEHFLHQYYQVDNDVVSNLQKLKSKINHQLFGEWIHGLIICQDNQMHIKSLSLVSEKLSQKRLLHQEIKMNFYNAKREFYYLVGFLLGIIPFLFVINYDWYRILVDTVIGKMLLALLVVVVIFTLEKVNKLCRLS